MPEGTPALLLEGVVKVFGAERAKQPHWPWFGRRSEPLRPTIAVDGIDLTVQRGEIYGVLGANGSGKSTLIRLISTLLLPDAGSIKVFGHDVLVDELTVKRHINRVSVEAAFFKKLSPMENLLYAARLYSLEIATARPAIIDLLGQLGIARQRIDEPLEKMSRGMQQKVAIARALLTSPVLLLLDEPTTGLDPRSKREVQQLILDLRHRHQATVLLTTHDMEEADRLCDRIAIIDRGRLVAEATPLQLKQAIGPVATLEEVFLQRTGRSLEDSDLLEEEAALAGGH